MGNKKNGKSSKQVRSGKVGKFLATPEGFERGREADTDEARTHLRPSEINRSVEAPTGDWVDVPRGMLAAPGTYIDDHGIMRDSSDGSVVVWHRTGCNRRGIQPHEITYDGAGAPWCPDCINSEIVRVDFENGEIVGTSLDDKKSSPASTGNPNGGGHHGSSRKDAGAFWRNPGN